MKDGEFLNWLHDHLVTHGVNRQLGYMYHLRDLAVRAEASLHPLMTQEEVAQALSIPVKRLKNWRENNTGGPSWIKVGNGAARYRREDVETWLLTRLRVPTVGKDHATS